MQQQRIIDLIKIYQMDQGSGIAKELAAAIKTVREGPHLQNYSDLGECEVFMLDNKDLDPAFGKVRDFLLSRLPEGEWKVQMWLNVMQPGQVIRPHHHGQLNQNVVLPDVLPTERDLWVGVYHVAGDAPLIVNVDAEFIRAEPVAGRLCVFPSNVSHEVPGPVTTERTTISINAYPLLLENQEARL